MNVPELARTAEKPVSCDLLGVLEEHNYSRQMIHALTGTSDRYVIGDRFHDGIASGHKKPTCKYHSIDICPQLNTVQSVTSEVLNSLIKSTRLQSSSQQNIVHYFIYNRLMDYWHNQDIVWQQKTKMLKHAKEGETVMRDKLHRFCYVCQKCLKSGHTATSCTT